VTLLRRSVGPLIIGFSVWCAAGHVTVSSADSAWSRVATLAPWWWFLAGSMLGCAVPSWRRDPRVTLPALLSVVPWLPLPLPSIALLFTGPAAWLPIAAAGFAVFWPLESPTAPVTQDTPPVSRRARHAALAAFLTVAIGGYGAWSVSPWLPTGDEPGYLIITQSLLLDGDLRIENNHQRGDYRSYYGGNLPPDFLRRGRKRRHLLHPRPRTAGDRAAGVCDRRLSWSGS